MAIKRISINLISMTSTISLVLLTSACSKIGLSNPFGGGQEKTASPYANATHYVCADKKHFYVRMLSNNTQAWLIYPDHEVSLNQTSSDKNRYTSGAISLDLNGDQTTLNDGEKVAYSACQAQK